jgi:hypothetical protein
MAFARWMRGGEHGAGAIQPADDRLLIQHAEAAVDLLERFSEVAPPVDDPDDLRGQRQYVLAGAVVHALLDIAASLRCD